MGQILMHNHFSRAIPTPMLSSSAYQRVVGSVAAQGESESPDQEHGNERAEFVRLHQTAKQAISHIDSKLRLIEDAP
jgi:hypothetical protein